MIGRADQHRQTIPLFLESGNRSGSDQDIDCGSIGMHAGTISNPETSSATVGAAVAGGKVEAPGDGKKDDISIGWTTGGGVGHAVIDDILVRGEYRYSDLCADVARCEFGGKDLMKASTRARAPPCPLPCRTDHGPKA